MSALKSYLSTRQACLLVARLGRDKAAHTLASLYNIDAMQVRTALLGVESWRMAE